MDDETQKRLSSGIRPATREEIEEHEEFFTAGLGEFRLIRYTDLAGRVVERQVHMELVAQIVRNLRKLTITDIMVFNALTGEADALAAHQAKPEGDRQNG